MFLDRIEDLFVSLDASERQDPAFVATLAEIALDTVARDRFMRFTEDTDLPVSGRMIRSRRVRLAHALHHACGLMHDPAISCSAMPSVPPKSTWSAR
jgi:hypothetical protein